MIDIQKNDIQCVLHVLTWPAWFVCDVPSIHRHGDPRHRGDEEDDDEEEDEYDSDEDDSDDCSGDDDE